MKLSIESPNVDDCFYSALRDHRNYGTKQQIRGTIRYEILDYSIGLTNSKQNVLFVPFRYSNLPAIIAETIWVLAGRGDMFFLRYYLKNAMKYSDDGETWRGNYGSRIRNYATFLDNGLQAKIDKIDNLIAYFRRDLSTTRGVLVIPDGKDYQLNEYGEEKIDEPCTMFIQYIMRNGELECFVRMRSNDVILGCFNVNLFEWTFLQQLIANELYTSVGPYNVNAVSMHIYDNWMKKLPLMLVGQLPIGIYSIIEPTQLKMTWSEFKSEINRLLAFELLLRSTNFQIEDPIEMLNQQNFNNDMRDIMLVMMVSMAIKKKAISTLKAIFSNISNTHWAIACMEFAARRLGSSFREFVQQCLEKASICPTREAQTAISDYIFHSYTEAEVLDRINMVRR